MVATVPWLFEAIQRLHGPRHPHTLNAANNYASALWGLGRAAEAEPLLAAGAEGLLQRVETMPASARFRVREAVARVVDLYVQWGEAEATAQRAELAARWRERLGALPSGGR